MRVPRYVRLLLTPPSLDIEQACWDMLTTLIAPRKLYKNLYYRQQTTGRWSREDPAFAATLCVFLSLSAIAWGFVSASGVRGIIMLMLRMVLVDFLAIGVLVATACWYIAKRLATRLNEPIEWAYCFDVHCNSYFVLFVYLNVLQFLLLPIIKQDNILSVFIGNTLYLAAWTHYFVITFLGYSVFPTLKNTQILLAPVGAMIVAYLPLLVCRVNVARLALDLYF